MIRLFINGLAASAGGGLTYLRNVIPHLARRVDAETTVWLNPAMRTEFGSVPNISFVETSESPGVLRRFIAEQTALPKLIRQYGAEVLISAGNFALWNSPIPQILLSQFAVHVQRFLARRACSGRLRNMGGHNNQGLARSAIHTSR